MYMNVWHDIQKWWETIYCSTGNLASSTLSPLDAYDCDNQKYPFPSF